jgi:hypothetical protein
MAVTLQEEERRSLCPSDGENERHHHTPFPSVVETIDGHGGDIVRIKDGEKSSQGSP